MSDAPPTPVKRRQNNKRNITNVINIKNFDNNNVIIKQTEQCSAKLFALWYKKLFDDDRTNVGPYLADDVILQWFGRTIRSRKKVISFIKYDMHFSKHEFTTIVPKEKLTTRESFKARTETLSLFGDEQKLASPLNSSASPDVTVTRKRPFLRSSSKSPQWESNQTEDKSPGRKRVKTVNKELTLKSDGKSTETCLANPDENTEISDKGDGVFSRTRKNLTPSNKEVGQGDCPATSSTDSMSIKSHNQLYAQLPHKIVECNGYVEFFRTKNSKSVDSMKWERKCKLQVSYSEDPLNMGEYIIWAIYYSDESRCRRNLLPDFEEVSKKRGGKLFS